MNKEFLTAYSKLLNEINSIKKVNDNPFYKSKYADLNTIFDEVKEKITANGFVLIQNVENESLHTQIIHIETGEKIESSFPLVTQKPDMQQLGSAVTYARRYSLLPMLNIETEDDDGNLATGNVVKAKSFDELETLEDFENAIDNCKASKQLGALYYNWSKKFAKGSAEYAKLQQLSSNKKNMLGE